MASKATRDKTGNIKATLKMTCGCCNPACKHNPEIAEDFDFAHLENVVKCGNPANMRDSVRLLLEELKKCIVLCKFCHTRVDKGIISWNSILESNKVKKYWKILDRICGE